MSMNYLELLNHSYAMRREQESGTSKLAWLGDEIFDLTTYDSDISEKLGLMCIDVCKAITDKTTFEYIKDEGRYLCYITAVNLPFFADKLNWGTSIRGAWWDISCAETFSVRSCGLYDGEDQLLNIAFNENEWDDFINSMVEFVRQ